MEIRRRKNVFILFWESVLFHEKYFRPSRWIFFLQTTKQSIHLIWYYFSYIFFSVSSVRKKEKKINNSFTFNIASDIITWFHCDERKSFSFRLLQKHKNAAFHYDTQIIVFIKTETKTKNYVKLFFLLIERNWQKECPFVCFLHEIIIIIIRKVLENA